MVFLLVASSIFYLFPILTGQCCVCVCVSCVPPGQSRNAFAYSFQEKKKCFSFFYLKQFISFWSLSISVELLLIRTFFFVFFGRFRSMKIPCSILRLRGTQFSKLFFLSLLLLSFALWPFWVFFLFWLLLLLSFIRPVGALLIHFFSSKLFLLRRCVIRILSMDTTLPVIGNRIQTHFRFPWFHSFNAFLSYETHQTANELTKFSRQR